MEQNAMSNNIKHPTSNKRLKISDDYSEVPLVQSFGDILSVDFQHDVVDTTTKPQLIHQEENTIKEDLKRVVQLYSKPYPYGCISSLLDADFLQQVIKEIKDNSTVNYKESDLFKFYQSIDLANLPSSSEASSSSTTTTTSTMPSVLKLRSMLYGSEFRHYIEDINQLPRNTLIDQVDCACNCHMTGCHLMCHDDVIRTRKVSYILYLTENDPIWDKTEGGALELYNSTPVEIESEQSTGSTSKRRIPLNIPECTVLPIFNSLVFFVVEPGYSFHAVQEVLGDRPRLSIQGWYHTSHKPDNIEYSTLQRLKSYQNSQVVQEEDTEGPFTPIEYPTNHPMIINASQNDDDKNTNDDSASAKTLSESDRIYLQKYIRDTYLTNDAIITIRNRFIQDSSIQLCNFLLDEYVQTINPLLLLSDIDRNKYIDPTDDTYYEWGCTKNWNMIGPPHKQRFLEYNSSDNDVSSDTESPTDQLGDCLYNTIRCKLLQSIPFANYLAIITNLGYPNSYRGRVRRFRPGRDYTIAHYGLLTQRSVLDATLCFVKGCSTTTTNHNNLENDHSQDNPTSDHNGDTSNDASIPSTSNNKSADDEILEEADEIWQSGDCGGFECYISADDDGDDDKDDDGDDNNNNDATKKIKKKDTAPDEYNLDTDENENDTELLNVSASNNTLSLVYRDPGTMRFIKYLSHTNAPSSRYDVTMEYEFINNDNNENDDDDDDDDDYDDDDLIEESDEIKVDE